MPDLSQHDRDKLDYAVRSARNGHYAAALHALNNIDHPEATALRAKITRKQARQLHENDDPNQPSLTVRQRAKLTAAKHNARLGRYEAALRAMEKIRHPQAAALRVKILQRQRAERLLDEDDFYTDGAPMQVADEEPSGQRRKARKWLLALLLGILAFVGGFGGAMVLLD